MTVAALPSVVNYLANGVTVDFAAPFRFRAASHLVVTRFDADGSATVLALGADYSVSGGGTDAGGTVTLTSAPAAGVRLRIERRTPRAQTMVYTTGDRFPAKSHEEALDTAMLIAQEQADQEADLSARALLAPQGETMPGLQSIAERAGYVTAFDGAGRLIGAFAVADVAAAIANAAAANSNQGLASAVLFQQGGVGAVLRSTQDKLRDFVSVEDFGAIGNGVADDLAAFQKCHDYCHSIGAEMHVGPGTFYLSDRLFYQAVSIIGAGSGVTFIKGAPGKDVIFLPDPSNPAGAGYARAIGQNWPECWTIEGVSIQVDATVSAVGTSRPLYPTLGSWPATTAVLEGQWRTTAAGGMVKCRKAGTTGSGEPAWPASPGIVADGTAEWEWVAPAQILFGNGGIVAPQLDGTVNAYIVGAILRDVRITQIGTPEVNGTVGCYFQRAPYRLQVDGLCCRFTYGGLIVAPPTTNFVAIEYAPDEPRIRALQMFCKFGFVAFNLFAGLIEGATYCNNTSERGIHLLEYRSLNRVKTSGVTILNHYAEGGSGISELLYLMGRSHTVISPYWSSNDTSQRIIVSGDDMQVLNPQVLLQTDAFVFLGTGNRVEVAAVAAIDVCDDRVGGNLFERGRIQSTATHTERPVAGGFYRPPALMRTADFLRHIAGPSYFGDESLLLGGRELALIGATQDDHVDLTLETGGFTRFTGGWYCQTANNGVLDVGSAFAPGRFPAGRLRVIIKARANAAASVSVEVGALTPGYVGLLGYSLALNTAWQTIDIGEMNLSAYGGAALQLNCFGIGAAAYVDIAWIGFAVVPDKEYATTGFCVAGTKVVGARGAAVADATDAASAITQLNALLARCRAHGLIA